MQSPVYISPISKDNSVTVTQDGDGKEYKYKSIAEAMKQRSRLIKIMKEHGLKVVQDQPLSS